MINLHQFMMYVNILKKIVLIKHITKRIWGASPGVHPPIHDHDGGVGVGYQYVGCVVAVKGVCNYFFHT
jgi:hypothetical protein